MTSAHTAWLRARIAEGVKRHAELVAQRTSLSDWPPSAWANPPALLVYATDAMYAYYLGPTGTVYQYDMDRALPSLDDIGDAELIREVYQRARETFPELADL